MSLRDTILGSDDIKTKVIEVPEWDHAKIEIRGMTGRQRMKLVDRGNQKQREYLYSDILIEMAFDPETGERVFEQADREALAEKAGGVLERISTAVIELSGVSVEEAEEAIKADPT